MPDHQVADVVKVFLAERSAALGRRQAPTPDSAVFDDGLLDSVALLELVTAVEQGTGQTVDMLSFDPSSVESVSDLIEALSSALQG